MPLSDDGKKILRRFKEEYGDEKGEEYFYSKEHDPKFSKIVRKGADPDSPIWWLLRLLNLPRNN